MKCNSNSERLKIELSLLSKLTSVFQVRQDYYTSSSSNNTSQRNFCFNIITNEFKEFRNQDEISEKNENLIIFKLTKKQDIKKHTESSSTKLKSNNNLINNINRNTSNSQSGNNKHFDSLCIKSFSDNQTLEQRQSDKSNLQKGSKSKSQQNQVVTEGVKYKNCSLYIAENSELGISYQGSNLVWEGFVDTIDLKFLVEQKAYNHKSLCDKLKKQYINNDHINIDFYEAIKFYRIFIPKLDKTFGLAFYYTIGEIDGIYELSPNQEFIEKIQTYIWSPFSEKYLSKKDNYESYYLEKLKNS